MARRCAYTELMKPLLTVFVLCPWLAVSALPQTTTLPPPQQALSQVRQYLGLTDSQVTAILQNNSDYNAFSFQQQDQIRQAQSQIAVETAKDPLDPPTIGNLYAGIETACRGLRDKAAGAQQQNISILTDVQKAKLSMLSDAMKLIPTISEAQSGNLLASPNSPPFAFSAYSSGIISAVLGFPPVSGCGVNGAIGGVLGGFLPPPAPSPTQPGFAEMSTTPAPANRTVNYSFDQTEFYRGGFQQLIKPQTKRQ
jgi:hypothetical protein